MVPLFNRIFFLFWLTGKGIDAVKNTLATTGSSDVSEIGGNQTNGDVAFLL